jgi:integrase
MAKRYELQRSDVERVWANHVAAAIGEQWPQRNSCRDTIQRFLDSVEVSDPSGSQRLVIDQREILRWMVQDVAGKALSYAAERLAVLDHLLKVLVQAGLVDTDLLAEYRADHGKRSWRCLARALQAANPETALAALPRTAPASGTLTAHVRSYIDLHQALGKDYRSQKTALQHFDRFLHAQAIASPQAITSALVEQWQGTLTCCAYLRVHRVRFVRRFFEYLRSLEVVMHNPVPRLLTSPRRMPHSAFRPYIFTREQLAAILAAARQLPDNHVCRYRAQICVTMLTLLHALGLRHGEVRRLRLCDLQLDRHTLFIAQTKFHKSRGNNMAGPKIPKNLREWLEARRRFHLSHAQVQMARELGMNPRKLGKLDNHKQESWKLPLPAFIETLYFKRFGKHLPDKVLTIEQRAAELAKKKAAKKQSVATTEEGLHQRASATGVSRDKVPEDPIAPPF